MNQLTILDAIQDERLFASWFGSATWKPWRTLLAALFALPFKGSDLERYRKATGRREWPEQPFTEAWLVIGRRGGKSLVAALVAVFLAAFRDYSKVLSPGERGTLMILAADRRQARTVFRYVSGLVDNVPLLAGMVEGRTTEAIHLSNRVSIEVHTASFRSVRGYTLVGAILDEVAFWRDDSSANPDAEVVAALRPGMSTVPGAMLIGISSPYARRGVLWEAYRDHWGRDDADVLVWQARTRAQNPCVPQSVIDKALEKDEASARAEYLAEFRRDIEGFVSREAVDAAVVRGRRELPHVDGVRYVAFTDPSGGAADSFTLAVAHREKSTAVLDLVREVKPPFSPEQVVEDFARELKRYRLREVVGDRYGAEWVAEAFRKAGITYTSADKPKSDLYRELLPAINSGTVELLDHDKLIAQLCALERRTARGGRDSIDHPPRGHDDVSNAVAGVVQLALVRPRGLTPENLFGDGGLYYGENGRPRNAVPSPIH